MLINGIMSSLIFVGVLAVVLPTLYGLAKWYIKTKASAHIYSNTFLDKQEKRKQIDQQMIKEEIEIEIEDKN
jgi:hypothetical protein